MTLWENVWLPETAEVLPRYRRKPLRGLWAVWGLLALDIVVGVNVALALL